MTVKPAATAADRHDLGAAKGLGEGMILDAGPASRAGFETSLAGAGRIVRNGPPGAFENPSAGPAAMAPATVAAAGDGVASLPAAGPAGRPGRVPSAGGALLACLEGRTLPGGAALMSVNTTA